MYRKFEISILKLDIVGNGILWDLRKPVSTLPGDSDRLENIIGGIRVHTSYSSILSDLAMGILHRGHC